MQFRVGTSTRASRATVKCCADIPSLPSRIMPVTPVIGLHVRHACDAFVVAGAGTLEAKVSTKNPLSLGKPPTRLEFGYPIFTGAVTAYRWAIRRPCNCFGPLHCHADADAAMDFAQWHMIGCAIPRPKHRNRCTHTIHTHTTHTHTHTHTQTDVTISPSTRTPETNSW